jgi:UDP-3-O-[3-hydroxymyristoyl] N-acetylglucosamine deacetylase
MNYINTTKSYALLQKTLKKKIHFSGVGVHNGRAVSMCIKPAEPDTGIVFERTDLGNNNIIIAVIDNVVESRLCTKIKNTSGTSVATIEHLMAAFSALGIDNAIVKINSSELPALDGSSNEYVKKLISCGIKVLDKRKKVLRVLKKVEVKNGDRFISITPSNSLSINISINYPETIIGYSEYSYTHTQESFINNLSKARTYTLYEDIEKMRTAGLAIGGSLNNAIVVDKYKILNPDGLRLEKEFVKHKTLDCIGDFYLLGMQLVGDVNCFAPGHNLNQQLIKEILKNKDNYIIEDIIPENNEEKFFDLIDGNNSVTNITCVA